MLPEVIAKLPTSTDLITDLFSTDDVANIDERRKVFASVTLVFKFIMGTAVVRTGEGDVLNMQPHLDAYPGILGVQHRGMDPDKNVAAISCLCRGDGLASWSWSWKSSSSGVFISMTLSDFLSLAERAWKQVEVRKTSLKAVAEPSLTLSAVCIRRFFSAVQTFGVSSQHGVQTNQIFTFIGTRLCHVVFHNSPS